MIPAVPDVKTKLEKGALVADFSMRFKESEEKVKFILKH